MLLAAVLLLDCLVQFVAMDVCALIGFNVIHTLLEELQELMPVSINKLVLDGTRLTLADFAGVLGVMTAVNSMGAMVFTAFRV